MTRQRSVRKDARLKRQPVQLPGKLDASLLTYALAASAAGIGMMTAMPAAEAEVVSSTANISVPRNGGLIQFDINRDGQMDFGLSYRSGFGPRVRRAPTCVSSCEQPFSYELKVVPAQAANQVWQIDSKAFGFSSVLYCAAALAPGKQVGFGDPFKPGEKAMWWFYGGMGPQFSACPFGQIKGALRHYLAVKFLDKAGKVHYGWVRVTLDNGATITGYAYETIPNKPITTGVTHGPVGDARLEEPETASPQIRVPATLGMLALGAPGLAAWRKAEEEQPE